MTITPDPLQWIDPLWVLMQEAGSVCLRLRESGLDIQKKSDLTAVTNADFAVDTLLKDKISALSSLPIVTEESLPTVFDRAKLQQGYWCVDPIDSTRDFIDGGSYFSINIALIFEGTPEFGAIYFPASNVFYCGIPKIKLALKIDSNAVRIPLSVRASPAKGLHVVVSSHSHGSEEKIRPYIGNARIEKIERLNGAMKFCKVAQGNADFYPRFTRISEWDIAAGDAIVTAAGGSVTDLEGRQITYGQTSDFACPEFLTRPLKF